MRFALKMKKGLKIMSLLAFLLVFAACEKCQKPVITEDPFVNSDTRGADSDKNDTDGSRGDDDILNLNNSGGTDGDITDPNEDEDFDGIVDPDEDEDFDQDDDGK